MPLERTRSALTGNPLASSIARVAIEDSLLLAQPEFEGVFELAQDCALDAQSWSDNLVCIATCIFLRAISCLHLSHPSLVGYLT